MISVACLGVIGTLLGMLTPFVLKFATDEATAMATGMTKLNFDTILLMMFVLAVAGVAGELINNITGYLGDMLAARMREQLSLAYYKHLLELPQSYYDNESTGTIISRLDRAIADVTRFIQMTSNLLLGMLLTVVISIGIMFWYSWEIALIVLVQIPIYIYLTMLTSKKWQKLESKKNKHIDRARGRFSEVVGNMRLVKSFGTERREANFFGKEFGATIGITSRQSRHWHIMDGLRSLVRTLVYAAVFTILFWRAASGQITIGDMVLILTLLQQTSQPLQNMSFFVDVYQRAVANSKDYAKVMGEPSEPRLGGGRDISAKAAQISYQAVNFAYDKKEVLKNVNFDIKPGQKLALVSQSGGGKTTIANLLMRLYTPTNGQILINNTPIAEASASSLRGMIATVFQDASLFSGTIRENIAYANPRATSKEIEKAARAANAWNFISEFDKGLDTEIGENGIKLSGGQRQRIAIARAILKDAPILILDEATSALDSQAEHEVQVALDRLMKGRTTLIIAHRLSTIAGVDTIVTLKHGKIDEIGTPAELAQSGGIYSQLLKLQIGDSAKAKQKLKQFDIAS